MPEGGGAIERKVRNWLHDRNIPKNREDLFKICFALELNEKCAEAVLGSTSESGIHYRNPRELVYAYCLRTGAGYLRARELASELWEKKYGNQKTVDIACLSSGIEMFPMTSTVRNDFRRIRTEKGLAAFLEQRRDSFGYFHNTSYRKFMKMLNHLSAPEASQELDLPKEKKYSADQIVNDYLRLGVPYDKRSLKYSRLAKEIKKHWPTPKSIREMASGRLDVDRKTLLLLYLATEEIRTLAHGKELFKEYTSRADLMLAECGLPLLNPHSPFDYLVLQAMNISDEEEFPEFRMEQMVKRIFGKGREDAYVVPTDRKKVRKKLPELLWEKC